MELDYQLGEDIKEKLIPRAIDWFTGEALQFEELDEDSEEGDFEDDDDEEDDDVSEDRDDDEESDEEVCLRAPHRCAWKTNTSGRTTAPSQSKKPLNASKANDLDTQRLLPRSGQETSVLDDGNCFKRSHSHAGTGVLALDSILCRLPSHSQFQHHNITSPCSWRSDY